MRVIVNVNKRTHEIENIKGNIGYVAQDCAAAKLHRHEVMPTFGYKLRRFCRRLRNYLAYQADIACSHIVGSQTAASMPYIGIEENSRGQ